MGLIHRRRRTATDLPDRTCQKGVTMAKLRHIALIVPDPEAAAKFFEQAFDMKRAGTARRGIYMSDGTVNVALLKKESGKEGNDEIHFYFWGGARPAPRE